MGGRSPLAHDPVRDPGGAHSVLFGPIFSRLFCFRGAGARAIAGADVRATVPRKRRPRKLAPTTLSRQKNRATHTNRTPFGEEPICESHVRASLTLIPKSGMMMPILGLRPRARKPRRNSLADALLTKTQQRVLGALFGQPERSFYASELIRDAGTGSGAAQRELARLEESGSSLLVGSATRSTTRRTRHRRCSRTCGISC